MFIGRQKESPCDSSCYTESHRGAMENHREERPGQTGTGIPRDRCYVLPPHTIYCMEDLQGIAGQHNRPT